MEDGRMPEPPELVYETLPPQQIVQRLDMIRERFRLGLLTVSQFNDALRLFQFEDEVGHIWSPGAQSGQWYRWDLTQWTADSPPEQLRVRQSPVLFTDFEQAPPPPAAAPTATSSAVAAAAFGGPATSAGPAAVPCPNCGAAIAGRKFCTRCGTRLVQA